MKNSDDGSATSKIEIGKTYRIRRTWEDVAVLRGIVTDIASVEHPDGFMIQPCSGFRTLIAFESVADIKEISEAVLNRLKYWGKRSAMKPMNSLTEKSMKTCANCDNEFEKLLRSDKGEVCEGCFVTIQQGTLPIDEYSFQPGEMTVEMAAFHADVTVRTIQNWKAQHILPYKKVKRRVDLENKEKLRAIIMVEDLDKLVAEKETETHLPAVVTGNGDGRSYIAQNRDASSGQMMQQVMAQMFEALQNSNKPTLLQLTGKVFVGIQELSEVTNIAVSVLKREISAAEKSGTLQRYPGKKGKAVWKSGDLTQVLGAIRPVDTAALYGKTNFGRGNNPVPGEVEETGGQTRGDEAGPEEGEEFLAGQAADRSDQNRDSAAVGEN